MRSSNLPALIFGPAYLDLVVRVAGPISHRPIDLGSDGHFDPDSLDRLEIICPNGAALIIPGLKGTACPTGRLTTANDVLPAGLNRTMAMIETFEDLGGMGSGYAAALGGRLVSALAQPIDPLSARVRQAIAKHGIDHRAVSFVDIAQADTTFIVTSGPSGDKLPIGLRGCHASLEPDDVLGYDHAPIVVAASLSNALMHAVLVEARESLRILAPSARNCRDRMYPLSRMAAVTDLLALNAGEWAELTETDRRAFEDSAAILSITRGPEGAEILWRNRRRERESHFEPAFPRRRPPVDTNRAGEAFATHLIRKLVETGWSHERRTVDERAVRVAALYASAAAGLVIGMPRFGFPSSKDVERIVGLGEIS
ncbi:hypothetical protein GC170_12005 [bacterium]|nr:hypothetical protein [bacterium]